MFLEFSLIGKRREILVDVSQLTPALAILAANKLTYGASDLSLGNCGWAKAPNCWFINVTATNKTWIHVLETMSREGINLLPETTGY